MAKTILDATAGSRMIWFDKQHPDVLYMDNRQLTTTLCDGRKHKVKAATDERVEIEIREAGLGWKI